MISLKTQSLFLLLKATVSLNIFFVSISIVLCTTTTFYLSFTKPSGTVSLHFG